VTTKARNEITVDAGPARVWAILGDGHTYPDWVVGAAESRKVDTDYPRPGATLHHTQIVPKVGLRDTSTVIEADEPRRMLLEVRIRPFAVSKVEFELEPVGDHTRVTMWEWGTSGIVPKLTGPLFELSLWVRNAETLRRLRNLAEKRG
jgi:uncharacterized protein YndB with AHSA1/START domain